MDSRGRVLAALDLEEPDRVPLFDWIYESKSFEKILGKSRVSPFTPVDYVRGHRALNLDLIVGWPSAPEGWVSKHISQDVLVNEWGIKSKATEGSEVVPWPIEGPIKKPEDLEAYQPPDPNAPGRMRYIDSILKIIGDQMAFSASAAGPFTQAWKLTGMERFIRWIYSYPDSVRRLMELTTEFDLEITKLCIDHGAEMIWIGDDLGYTNGLILSPQLTRRCVLPYMRRIVQESKKRGAKVLLHCDGDVRLIMDDLVDMEIDGFHPMERAAGFDIRQMKERYGDRLCLIGNVENKHLLPFGTLDEIAGQTKGCIDIAAPGGGYILASDHSIHVSIPYQKAKCMFDTAKKYGCYPR